MKKKKGKAVDSEDEESDGDEEFVVVSSRAIVQPKAVIDQKKPSAFQILDVEDAEIEVSLN